MCIEYKRRYVWMVCATIHECGRELHGTRSRDSNLGQGWIYCVCFVDERLQIFTFSFGRPFNMYGTPTKWLYAITARSKRQRTPLNCHFRFKNVTNY